MKIKKVVVSVLATILAIPVFLTAVMPVMAEDGGGNDNTGNGASWIGWTKVGAYKDQTDPSKIIQQDILNGIFGFVVLISVSMLIYAGFVFATAAGDDGKITKAQKSATYAVVGLIVAFVAGLIVRWVMKTILGIS